jgi:hypothetical protein
MSSVVSDDGGRAMRIPRLARFLAVGLTIGLWYSAMIHSLEGTELRGEIPEAHIHGSSVIMLGFFSLPWSMPVWFAGIMLSDILGAEVPACPAWLYWCMPLIAGLGWGWLVGVISAKVRSNRSAKSDAGRPSVDQ